MLYISRCRKMCEVTSFKNFANSLTTVKVMTKTIVAPFYLGHGIYLPVKLLVRKQNASKSEKGPFNIYHHLYETLMHYVA